MEGEEADPDYFGRDTGDASKDDPRNQDDIGENEILVVSFGTSFNGIRGKKYSCIIENKTQWMGFPHLYYPSNPVFARAFVDKARKYKEVMI